VVTGSHVRVGEQYWIEFWKQQQGLNAEGISELTDDGVGRARTGIANPQKPGVKAGSKVTKVFLQHQARAADLVAEQERSTKQVKAATNQAERLQRELTRPFAQLDLEADTVGIRVRGCDDAPNLAFDDDEETIELDPPEQECLLRK
jgi:uncharacterized cupredoxin-like copper-binding protein